MKINRNIFNNNNYQILNTGAVDFLGISRITVKKKSDILDIIKTNLKIVFHSYYLYLIYFLSPVLPRIHWQTKETYLNYMIRKCIRGKINVVNVGGGPIRLGKNVINLDIFPYDETDVVADCTRLPFKNNVLDGIISIGVLEHVKDPEAFIKEAYRVLKQEGFIITSAPFLLGFHSSPCDYQRWTKIGLETIHERHGFHKKEITPIAGPTYSLIWILQEYFSILLSLDNEWLYFFWYVLFSIVLLPLKLLDLILLHYRLSDRIGSIFLYIGEK